MIVRNVLSFDRLLINEVHMKSLYLQLLLSTISCVCQDADWSQAAGPKLNWKINNVTKAPTSWSVAKNINIKWKVKLPEGG